MDEAFEEALAQVGGLAAAKPKALHDILQPQFSQLDLQRVKCVRQLAPVPWTAGQAMNVWREVSQGIAPGGMWPRAAPLTAAPPPPAPACR